VHAKRRIAITADTVAEFHTFVNLAAILEDADADPEGLVVAEDWGPTGERSGKALCPVPEKNEFFRLK